jgi:RNA polymerase sigma factor (sigma-70 family)
VSNSAANKLFDDHQYIVATLVRYLIPKCNGLASYAELYQWGLIGLWDGCCRWSGPEDEFKFYAKSRVKGQIFDELRVVGPFPRGMYRRDHSWLTNIDDVPIAAEDTAPDELVHTRRQLSKLLKHLRRLTLNERRVFVQHFFLDETLTVVAKSMQLSLPRVAQLRSAAVTRLARKSGILYERA